MLSAIQKARQNVTYGARRQASELPRIFRPPYGGTVGFGSQANRWALLNTFRFWQYIAIQAHIDEIAGGQAPLVARKVKKKPKAPKIRTKALTGASETSDLDFLGDGDPMIELFRNPNPPDVSYDLWAYHTLFYWLFGTAYWWVRRNDAGFPKEIWVIPTHWVRMVTGADGMPESYQVQTWWGQQMDLPPNEIITFVRHGPLNRFEGVPPSAACGNWVDVYDALMSMRLGTFLNSGLPSLHVELGEKYGDPDDAWLERFYSKWAARFGGPQNAGKPLISGADIAIRGIDGHRPGEILASSVQGEEALRDMILSAFKVPKGVVGLEPISDTSAYAPQRQFCRFAINPQLEYFGQVVTEKILRPTPNYQDCVFYWNDRVADDAEFLERQMLADIADGTMTVNEKRALRGRESYEFGGDEPMINGTPQSWATGETIEDTQTAQAFERAWSGAAHKG